MSFGRAVAERALCEWNPDANEAAFFDRGCPEDAQYAIGVHGGWHLCAECAGLKRFRRYRIATNLKTGRVWRRSGTVWQSRGVTVTTLKGAPP